MLWVKRAKEEHDAFAEVMRDRGVEVFLAETLLSEALVKPDAKSFIEDARAGRAQRRRRAPPTGPGSGWRRPTRPRWPTSSSAGITRQDVTQ